MGWLMSYHANWNICHHTHLTSLKTSSKTWQEFKRNWSVLPWVVGHATSCNLNVCLQWKECLEKSKVNNERIKCTYLANLKYTKPCPSRHQLPDIRWGCSFMAQCWQVAVLVGRDNSIICTLYAWHSFQTLFFPPASRDVWETSVSRAAVIFIQSCRGVLQWSGPLPGEENPPAPPHTQHQDRLRLPDQPQLLQLGRGDPEHGDLSLLWPQLHEEQTTDEPRLSDETNREIEIGLVGPRNLISVLRWHFLSLFLSDMINMIIKIYSKLRSDFSVKIAGCWYCCSMFGRELIKSQKFFSAGKNTSLLTKTWPTPHLDHILVPTLPDQRNGTQNIRIKIF